MEKLRDLAEQMPDGNKCLNYIASHALYALSSKPGHRDRVASVRSRYLEVGRFRSETEQLNGRTLSLLVAELRLEKITGPMHR
jgi:hypothetical protein